MFRDALEALACSHQCSDALVRSQENRAARPLAPGEKADGDEIVVFDTRCILPQFVVEVTLSC